MSTLPTPAGGAFAGSARTSSPSSLSSSISPIGRPPRDHGRLDTPRTTERDAVARRGAPRHGATTPSEIDAAWSAYKSSGSVAARNTLVGYYMRTHVRPIAARLHAGLPSQVDVDDLVQQGYLGLIDSMDRFDRDRNTRFETFSRRRISGAIRDYLRAIDPIPRLARTRFKQVQAARERFGKEYGRPPTDEELIPMLEFGPAPVDQVLRGGDPAAMVSFSSVQPDGDGDDADSDAMSSFQAPRDSDPAPHIARRDLQRWLTRGFDDRDRLIVVLYYYEQLTMGEVGVTLGISESRVSQRLDAIIKCLRARFAHEPVLEFV